MLTYKTETAPHENTPPQRVFHRRQIHIQSANPGFPCNCTRRRILASYMHTTAMHTIYTPHTTNTRTPHTYATPIQWVGIKGRVLKSPSLIYTRILCSTSLTSARTHDTWHNQKHLTVMQLKQSPTLTFQPVPTARRRPQHQPC